MMAFLFPENTSRVYFSFLNLTPFSLISESMSADSISAIFLNLSSAGLLEECREKVAEVGSGTLKVSTLFSENTDLRLPGFSMLKYGCD